MFGNISIDRFSRNAYYFLKSWLTFYPSWEEHRHYLIAYLPFGNICTYFKDDPCTIRHGNATLVYRYHAGDHSVIFAGPGERIILEHRATSREVFAKGAVKAALWARDKKPGLYSMRDVLGI